MALHEVQLIRRETVAEGTMAFYFSRPAGFEFRAGQLLLLGLMSPLETDCDDHDEVRAARRARCRQADDTA